MRMVYNGNAMFLNGCDTGTGVCTLEQFSEIVDALTVDDINTECSSVCPNPTKK